MGEAAGAKILFDVNDQLESSYKEAEVSNPLKCC